MKQLFALLLTFSALQAAPIIPVPTGPETQVTRTLKTNATHQGWRDALDVPGYENWTKDVSAAARFSNSLTVSNAPASGKTNYSSSWYVGGPVSITNVVIDIREVGATGDDQSSDDVALSKAIGAVSSWNGGTVFLPRGRFHISSTLLFTGTNDIKLKGLSSINSRGDGPDDTATIIKLVDGANCDMLHKTTGARVSIEGIVFDGNKANQTVGDLKGIWLESTSANIDRCTVENVLVRNVKGVGIRNDAREARYYNVKSEHNDGDGFYHTASSDAQWDWILSGFNGGNGMVYNGANSTRIKNFDFYRNALEGLVLTNANNNSFLFGKCDANVQNGLLLSSKLNSFSYRNLFIGVDFVKNNFFWDINNDPTTIPSGTYSSVKLVGDLTIDNIFYGCRFWEAQDPSELVVKPKYQFEDAREYYLTNNFIGGRTTLRDCNFITDTNYSVLGPFQTNLVRYANLDSILDGSRLMTDNLNLRAIQAIDLRATDELESALGMEGNVYFNAAATNFLFRQDGAAGWQIRQRFDNPVWGLQYATGPAVADAVATLVTALNMNSTNGYVGIGLGDTPAVEQLEVQQNIKAGLIETQDGALFNAYYDAATTNFLRRANGYAFKLQAQAGYSNFVLSVTGQGAADSVITWTDGLAIRQDGAIDRVMVPQSQWSITSSGTGDATNRFYFDTTGTYHNGRLGLRSTTASADEVTFDGTTFTVSGIPLRSLGNGATIISENSTTNAQNYIALRNFAGASDRGTIGFLSAANPTRMTVNNNFLGGIYLTDTTGVFADGPIHAPALVASNSITAGLASIDSVTGNYVSEGTVRLGVSTNTLFLDNQGASALRSTNNIELRLVSRTSVGAGHAILLDTKDVVYIVSASGIFPDTPAAIGSNVLPVSEVVAQIQYAFNDGVMWRRGAGDPNGNVTAPVGSLYTRTDGGAGTTLYVKEVGADDMGWVAK